MPGFFEYHTICAWNKNRGKAIAGPIYKHIKNTETNTMQTNADSGSKDIEGRYLGGWNIQCSCGYPMLLNNDLHGKKNILTFHIHPYSYFTIMNDVYLGYSTTMPGFLEIWSRQRRSRPNSHQPGTEPTSAVLWPQDTSSLAWFEAKIPKMLG